MRTIHFNVFSIMVGEYLVNTRLKRRNYSDEKGVILHFVILITIVLGFMFAISVDLIRVQIASRSVRNSATAMSHACANLVSQKFYGWLDAKRQPLSLFEKNPIYGHSGTKLVAHAVGSGAFDFYESKPLYGWTHFDWPEVEVDIQRGIYADDGTGTFAFSSIEGQMLEPDNPADPTAQRVYQVANACQVTVKLKTLNLFFTQLLPNGFKQITDIKSTVTSANEGFRT